MLQIAVLEERSKVEKKVEQEVEKQLVGWLTSKDDTQNIGDGFKSETQVSPSYNTFYRELYSSFFLMITFRVSLYSPHFDAKSSQQF